MPESKPLSAVAFYPDEKTNAQNITIADFVTVDNLVANKSGKVLSEIQPAGQLTKFCAGDTLVGNIRPYLKKIWFANHEGGCTQDVIAIRSNGKIDPQFLYYSLFRDDFFSHMMKGAKGTKMPRGDRKHVLGFKIPDFLPSDERKIAAVLSTLDAKIELNNRINRELEALAKTIYDYWFVQFDFPDENGRPYRSSGGKMTYNETLKREIPFGWEVKNLSDCLELIIDHRGKTPKKLGGDWVYDESGIVALSARHVKNNKLIDLDQANKVNRRLFDKWMPEKLRSGDILMTSEAPLGEFYFFAEKDEYCLSQRLFAMRPDVVKVLPCYLFFELSRGNGRSQILGGQSGSTVFGIRQDELRKVLIMKPSHNVQERFQEIAFPMFTQIRMNETQNRELARLRDWLLPMLMNGQVTIKEQP